MTDTSLRSVLPQGTKVLLSSNAPSSSRKKLLDTSNEEPWTAPSLPSYIHLVFSEPVHHATHVALTFQGGFVATEALLYAAMKGRSKQSEVEMGLMMGGKLYPEDKNARQVFEIVYPPQTQQPNEEELDRLPKVSSPGPGGPEITTEVPPNPSGGGQPAEPLLDAARGELETPSMTELKIEFEKSSDQYGRVTLYSIEVLG